MNPLFFTFSRKDEFFAIVIFVYCNQEESKEERVQEKRLSGS
jgi:hypothetical protein